MARTVVSLLQATPGHQRDSLLAHQAWNLSVPPPGASQQAAGASSSRNGDQLVAIPEALAGATSWMWHSLTLETPGKEKQALDQRG